MGLRRAWDSLLRLRGAASKDLAYPSVGRPKLGVSFTATAEGVVYSV